MKTYYFDNSERVYRKRLVVISETQFRKVQDNFLPGWGHHWISGEFRNLKEAEEYFRKEWFEA